MSRNNKKSERVGVWRGERESCRDSYPSPVSYSDFEIELESSPGEVLCGAKHRYFRRIPALKRRGFLLAGRESLALELRQAVS